MKYDSTWYKLWSKVTNVCARINWCPGRALFNGGKYWSLTEEDHNYIRKALRDDYFIVLTARSCHLTTYLIRILSYLKGDKNAYYSHALMNTENDADYDYDYRLIEATGNGVHYSTFMQVFDVDSVVLLKPKNILLTDWTMAVDAAKADEGIPYDNAFDISDSTHMSCVELVYNALQKIPDYQKKFPNLIEMIKNEGNLTPQMLRDCPDFIVHWEIKR